MLTHALKILFWFILYPLNFLLHKRLAELQIDPRPILQFAASMSFKAAITSSSTTFVCWSSSTERSSPQSFNSCVRKARDITLNMSENQNPEFISLPNSITNLETSAVVENRKQWGRKAARYCWHWVLQPKKCWSIRQNPQVTMQGVVKEPELLVLNR